MRFKNRNTGSETEMTSTTKRGDWFTKKSKKAERMMQRAYDAHDAGRYIELSNIEYEGWKQGFTRGIAITLLGLGTGALIGEGIYRAIKHLRD